MCTENTGSPSDDFLKFRPVAASIGTNNYKIASVGRAAQFDSALALSLKLLCSNLTYAMGRVLTLGSN